MSKPRRVINDTYSFLLPFCTQQYSKAMAQARIKASNLALRMKASDIGSIWQGEERVTCRYIIAAHPLCGHPAASQDDTTFEQ